MYIPCDISPCCLLEINRRLDGAWHHLMDATCSFQTRSVVSFISTLPCCGSVSLLSLSSMPREECSIYSTVTWKEIPVGKHRFPLIRKSELCTGSPCILYLLTCRTYSSDSDIMTQIKHGIFYSHKNVFIVCAFPVQPIWCAKIIIWHFRWGQWIFL
jgi:hypothetical protein